MEPSLASKAKSTPQVSIPIEEILIPSVLRQLKLLLDVRTGNKCSSEMISDLEHPVRKTSQFLHLESAIFKRPNDRSTAGCTKVKC